MQSILIKSAKVISAYGKFKGKTQDILIVDGIIKNISDHIEFNANKIIKIDDLHVSEGWFDSCVSFGEPGYEQRETIQNGGRVASLSGFTDILLVPNTNPVIDCSAGVSFIKSQSENLTLNIHPVGSFTEKSKSSSLAELRDMKENGALAFYDYKVPISNPNLLKTALLYSQTFDGLIMSFPMNHLLSNSGVMNEGLVSTKYGVKGQPSISEEIQINRDLKILEYSKGKLHIPTISTKSSVDLIRQAKDKGLDISCSVSIHNLFFNEDKLMDFDTRFKLLPPLRTELDRKALIKGVDDGTIDMVTSDHCPIEIDCKKMDITNALFGSIGLESIFGALLSIFSLEKTIKILTKGRERFNITTPEIKLGNYANISLFLPNQKYIVEKSNIKSKSKNSSFIGSELEGKAIGSINGSKIIMND